MKKKCKNWKIFIGIYKYENMTRKLYLWVGAVIIFWVLCMSGVSDGKVFEQIYDVKLNAFDLHAWILRGRFPYEKSMIGIENFTLPKEWLVFCLFFLYILGDICGIRSKRYEMIMILKSENMSVWYFSKLWWSSAMALFYYMLFVATELMVTELRGADYSEYGIEMYMETMFPGIINMLGKNCLFFIMTLPFLGLLLLAVVHIVLSLFIRIELVYIAEVAMLVGTTYFHHACLPSAYTMLVRYTKTTAIVDYHPLNPAFGMFYLVVCVLVVSVLGYVQVRKKDIVSILGYR